MDDPISALDAHVRKQIFQRVFRGMLKNKTRILATHAIDFVHLADRVIVMKDGEVKVQGTHQEVMEHELVKEIYEIHNKNKKANLEKIVEKDEKVEEEKKVEEEDTGANTSDKAEESDDDLQLSNDKN